MEATLKASSLKNFTKNLSCLSKYGDQLTFQATREGLALSCTNSSKSAYARFTFAAAYWKKWAITRQPPFTFSTQPLVEDVKGEVSIKVLLSILRARATDKTVESVDIELYDGPGDSATQNNEQQDELSSQLIIRVHCKQGVTRMHRLNISVPTIVLGPRLPDDSVQASKLRISADAVKDVLEHFSLGGTGFGKGKPRDLQLVWEFSQTKVKVKSVEVGKGSDYLSTALYIDSREFDAYEIYDPPMSVAFQLREFSATITHAEQLSLPLNMHFTDPGSPLFIEIETDDVEDPDRVGQGLFETFFAIATTTVDDDDDDEQATVTERDKRSREESASMADRRPTKRKTSNQVVTKSIVAPSQVSLCRISQAASAAPSAHQQSQVPLGHPPEKSQEPLFLPSQLSQREQQILQDSGWGDGDVAYEDFAALMDDEGEEVHPGQGKNLVLPSDGEADSQKSDGSEGELPATRLPVASNFRPLFDD